MTVTNHKFMADTRPFKELTARSLFLLFGLCAGRMYQIDVNGEYKDDLCNLYEAGLIEPESNTNKNYHHITACGRKHIEGLCKEPLPVACTIWCSAREVENLLSPIKESK